PMLSMYLFTKIGSTSFNKKREYWKYPSLPQNITNVSRKFTEVFSNFSLQPLNIREDSYQDKNKSHSSYDKLDDIDFEVLFTHLKGTFVDRKFFKKTVRENIVKLAELFSLKEYDMKSVDIKETDKNKEINLKI